MNKYILRFGVYSGITMLVLFGLTWAIFGTSLGYKTSEVLGYLSMFISLSFIYFGVKTYRDEQNGGQITLGKAFLVGLLIALIPSLFFAIYTGIFITLQGEEWMQWALENMPPSQRSQFDANPELFTNPWFQGVVMFFTVFVIGLAYSLISAFLVKRKVAIA
ncbi:MAG: DUF4199 domain-containing protein [Saprospiraceae bacterium]|nr:DUF4199 domain-containing protein [Saprospiraceae bacterium]